MGFGICTYANCCAPGTYNVLSLLRSVRVIDAIQPQAPETQWDTVRGATFAEWESLCPVPEGWRMSQSINRWQDLRWDVTLGATPIFTYLSDGGETLHGPASLYELTTNNIADRTGAVRRIRSHAGMGVGGAYVGGLQYAAEVPSNYGRGRAGASMYASAWVWIVPVEEGESLASRYGATKLYFKLRLNQTNPARPFDPIGLPDTKLDHADWNFQGQVWENILASFTTLGDFDVVVGNAAGRSQYNLGGSLTDRSLGAYWIMRRLIRREYNHVTGIPGLMLPRNGDPVDWELDMGLDGTTQITDREERDALDEHGAVWFLAIIPHRVGQMLPMCLGNVFPIDLPYVRMIESYYAWLVQMWVQESISSLNVWKLDAQLPSGRKVIVPFVPAAVGDEPTL